MHAAARIALVLLVAVSSMAMSVGSASAAITLSKAQSWTNQFTSTAFSLGTTVTMADGTSCSRTHRVAVTTTRTYYQYNCSSKATCLVSVVRTSTGTVKSRAAACATAVLPKGTSVKLQDGYTYKVL